MQGVRGAARFGFLALIAVAVLAGFGTAALRQRLGRRAWWPVVAAIVIAAVNAEALRAPITYRPFDGIPRIYQALRDSSVGAVAEFPFYPPAAILRNAPYVLNSSAHWKPLVNGYSGFVPASYPGIAEALRNFPDGRSRAGTPSPWRHTRRRPPRRVRRCADALASALHTTPWLALVASEGTVRIYRLVTS